MRYSGNVLGPYSKLNAYWRRTAIRAAIRCVQNGKWNRCDDSISVQIDSILTRHIYAHFSSSTLPVSLRNKIKPNFNEWIEIEFVYQITQLLPNSMAFNFTATTKNDTAWHTSFGFIFYSFCLKFEYASHLPSQNLIVATDHPVFQQMLSFISFYVKYFMGICHRICSPRVELISHAGNVMWITLLKCSHTLESTAVK